MSRQAMGKLNVHLEVGTRRTIAAALDWPGWCRIGQEEASALQSLVASGPRWLGFQTPGHPAAPSPDLHHPAAFWAVHAAVIFLPRF